MWSYYNGKFVQSSDLALPVLSDITGTFRGYRIFTACKTVGDKVFYLDDHIDRLFNSAKQIYMDIPHSKDELKSIILKTVYKNKEEYTGDLLLEIIYSGGPADSSGVSTKGNALLYILAIPLKLPKSSWYKEGIVLASFEYQRQWPEVKLLNYVGAVVAHKTVVKKYNAHEALFISLLKDKTVLEGTTFNFFIIKNSVLMTHPIDGKILPGITRKVVLNLAKKLKIKVKECYFNYNDLKSAQEAFITSSTRNVVPVSRIDDIIIGDGKPGEVARILMEEFKLFVDGYDSL